MAYYRSVGRVPPKRHTQHRDPRRQLYLEELMGEEGFSSDSSLLYHRGVPSAIVDSRIVGAARPAPHAQPPAQAAPPEAARPFDRHGRRGHRRRHRSPAGPRQQRRPDLLRRHRHRPVAAYRNAIGDECVYVEAGRGTVETVFGASPTGPATTSLIPRATDAPLGARPSRARLYAIEANSHIAPPKRYLSRFGQLLEHAPYCERDLHGPTEPLARRGTATRTSTCWSSTADRPGQSSARRMTYATHPFDVVGWDGCLYPYTFNIDDYMPITGKVHQPPPVHQVFEGWNFVVCNFLPRKVDYHPLAIPVPYYHSNVDSDEVMFYVGGDYEARKGSGISLGSISLHPGGHAHGPQPSAIEASLGERLLRRARPSWSTPSARSSSARPGSPCEDGATPGPGPAEARTPERAESECRGRRARARPSEWSGRGPEA